MKHWKTLTLIAFFTVVVNITLTSCSDAEASKAVEVKHEAMQMADVYLQDLKEAGFTRTPSLTKVTDARIRQKYLKEYGLNYIGETELEKLCRDNNILLGEPSSYIGEIPEEQVKNISDNMQKLKATPLYTEKVYPLPDGRVFTQADYNSMPDGIDKRWVREYIKSGTEIRIAAPRELFNTTGMVVEDGYKLEKAKPVDPIVVAKLSSGGYIELARWK